MAQDAEYEGNAPPAYLDSLEADESHLPFTQRKRFNYMLSFIKGAEMDRYYNNTLTCFFSYVAYRDDWFYYQ